MQSNYRRLGDHIQELKVKNTDLKATVLLGINIDKFFMPSVANVIGTDMANYRVVYKNQFACNRMHVGRDYRIPIALSSREEPFIVSPAYDVFEIIDTSFLLPEYLMMWFSRKEFDRNAWFHTDADVRGGLPWKLFCDLKLPIPPPEKQLEILREYNVIQNRIKLNLQLIAKLEETAQGIYKHWFMDFEFPDQNGLPYKSSGGEMVESQLGQIPKGWGVGVIGDLFTFQRGHDLPSRNRKIGKYPIVTSSGIADFHDNYKINKTTIITGRSGSLGDFFLLDKPCWPLNTTLYIVEFKKSKPLHALYFLQTLNLKEMGTGSAVPTLNRNDVHVLQKVIPAAEMIDLFESKVHTIYCLKQNYNSQIQKLTELHSMVLSRLATANLESFEIIDN